jgi:hypothetical protein
MARKKRKVDERDDIVNCVVMLGDAERPAKFGARRLCVGVGRLTDHFGGDTRFARGAFQGVFLDACFVSFETAGRMLDEFLVREAGGDDFAAHGVGQGNVRAHIQS